MAIVRRIVALRGQKKKTDSLALSNRPMVKEWSGPYLGIERGLANLKPSKEQQVGGQECLWNTFQFIARFLPGDLQGFPLV